MPKKRKTFPAVYIIESLDFDDEENDRLEGEVLRRHLNLAGVKCKYVYIRTKPELREVLGRFEASRFRYLHLSCHGDSTSIGLTLDSVSHDDLAQLLAPVMHKRRFFLSACAAATKPLAKKLFARVPGCHSMLGPRREVGFEDAAIFWASFYHLMLSNDQRTMQRAAIHVVVRRLALMYRVPINAFFNSEARGVEAVRYPGVRLNRARAQRVLARRRRLGSRK